MEPFKKFMNPFYRFGMRLEEQKLMMKFNQFLKALSDQVYFHQIIW
tara:strand:- start:272 stop:409 length:138 start_codon:yes stop_codon:yes gene_type:complete